MADLKKPTAKGRVEHNPFLKPAFAFAGVILIFVLFVFFKSPNLSDDQRDILRFLFALLGATSATFFVGSAVYKAEIVHGGVKVAISGTAGFAVFLLLYLHPPYWFVAAQPPKPLPKISISSLTIQNHPDLGKGYPMLTVTFKNPFPYSVICTGFEWDLLDYKGGEKPLPFEGFPSVHVVLHKSILLVELKDGDISGMMTSEKERIFFLNSDDLGATGQTEFLFVNHRGEEGKPNSLYPLRGVCTCRITFEFDNGDKVTTDRFTVTP